MNNSFYGLDDTSIVSTRLQSVPGWYRRYWSLVSVSASDSNMASGIERAVIGCTEIRAVAHDSQSTAGCCELS